MVTYSLSLIHHPLCPPHRMGLVTNDHVTPGTMLPVATVAWPQFPAPHMDNVLLFTIQCSLQSWKPQTLWDVGMSGGGLL